ncbi:MAG: DUF4388 domain-containing protein [Deltaproteobacteria bacterium]|nr:DUF4388 domain-containing protein [Deltaproteobacteria bacterium]
MEFSGRLVAFPPSELLQWAHNERRTGALVFRRSRRQKRVYFRNGSVVACLSDDPADYYGQHLLLNGYLNEAQLVDALSYCTRSGKRLGLALTELGLLTEDQVQETLSQQISDSVCGLFLWNHGVFYFEEEFPPEEEILPSPIETMALVLEGSRWIDDFARFRKVFPHDNVVLCRGPVWPGVNLLPVQQRIHDVVDGEKTLAKIHWRIKGSYFRVLQGAYNLCMTEVLDLGAVGEALETTSLEINVYDLLLEQAVEEQSVGRDDSHSLPLGVLGHMRPIWIQDPSADDLSSLPEDLREIAGSFDGATRLSSLIPRGSQPFRSWDYLVEQLRKGTLALLPASPQELESRGLEKTSWWNRLFSSSSR